MQNILWYQNEQYLSFLHQIVNCYSWCQIVRGVKLSTMWNCPRILQKGTDGRRMRWEGVMCKPLYENWRPVAIIEHGALVPFCSVIFKKVSSLGWIWEGWGGCIISGLGRWTNIARLPNGFGWTVASYPLLLHSCNISSTTNIVGFPK